MLNGKKESEHLLLDLKKRIESSHIKPGLAVILVGDDQSSQTYVSIKEKRAQEIGVHFEKYIFEKTVPQKKVQNLIQKLNKDQKVHGILLQLPLPVGFDTDFLIHEISAKKDVDGFFFSQQKKGCKPPVLVTILHFIKKTKKNMIGKRAAVVCHSTEFAESISFVLQQKKIATDILISPRDKKDLKKYDLVIVALGQKYWLKPDKVKKNAILIDVGINHLKNSKNIFGDIDPECSAITSFMTPVPGGVGPMTVASLLKNLVQISNIK
jgi:methylenetetrahydrofolate dehydrogenase (NADP+) / methenyltetrahydrofolate cyclohydrolase